MKSSPTIPSIVFFGNTKYSTMSARILHQQYTLTAIVTTADKPKGRSRILTPNAVKLFAKENNIEVIESENLDSGIIEKIKSKIPDFLIVADFGLILPDALLNIPKYAPLNIHHSLLPKYRGPSPAPSVILAGDEISGVTIIKMTDRVDAGPILAQKKYRLDQAETTDSLLTALNTLGAEILIGTINDYLEGKAKPVDQDELLATHTRRLTKEDGRIDLENPPDPQKLNRMIRAFHPWPGVWTEIKLEVKSYKLKVIRIKFLPPTIQRSNHPSDSFLIQPEGKRPMTIKEFLNGYPQTKMVLGKLLQN